MPDQTDTLEAVRRRYAEAALRVQQLGAAATCCGDSACCQTTATAAAQTPCCEKTATSQTTCCAGPADPVTGNLYALEQLAALPAAAAAASLGCGNPTALIELRAGETVLDLGSGGGIDVLLSARRAGPAGKAYGLDMTDEMLALARQNAAQAGAANVEFLQGQIEAIPLPEAAVDVVISNCVINLSADKGQVLREAFRVLKPGGRLAVSDVVVNGPVPAGLRRQVELWVGCIAGALERQEYLAKLEAAGFTAISIEPTRFYHADDLDDPHLNAWLAAQPPAERERLSHAFMSTFIRATKPAR